MLQKFIRALFGYACFALLPLCAAANVPMVPSHLKVQDNILSTVQYIPKAHKHNSHRTLKFYFTDVMSLAAGSDDSNVEECKIKFYVIDPRGYRYSSKEIYLNMNLEGPGVVASIKNPIIEIEDARFGNYIVCYEITDTMGNSGNIMVTIATTNTGDSTKGKTSLTITCSEVNVGQIIPAGQAEVSRKH